MRPLDQILWDIDTAGSWRDMQPFMEEFNARLQAEEDRLRAIHHMQILKNTIANIDDSSFILHLDSKIKEYLNF